MASPGAGQGKIGLVSDVQLIEVGPRDGLQNEQTLLSVEEKIEFIARAVDAGVRLVVVITEGIARGQTVRKLSALASRAEVMTASRTASKRACSSGLPSTKRARVAISARRISRMPRRSSAAGSMSPDSARVIRIGHRLAGRATQVGTELPRQLASTLHAATSATRCLVVTGQQGEAAVQVGTATTQDVALAQ